jgi:hypothetical protein
LKVAAIFRTRLRLNPTSTAMARRILEVVTGHRWAIVRMAETAADGVVVRVAAGAIEDVGGAADVRVAVVAADEIEADVAALAGGDTRNFFATDLHG